MEILNELVIEALLEAFPTVDELWQFIRLRLSPLHHHLSASASLRTLAFELVQRADANGVGLEHLVRDVRRWNQGNQMLKELESRFASRFSTEQLMELDSAVETLALDRDRLRQLVAGAGISPYFTPPALGGEPQWSFWRVIVSLAQSLEQTTKVDPLHAFVGQLLAQADVDEPTARKLETWLQDTGGTAVLNRPRRVTDRSRPLRLFVKCELSREWEMSLTPESEIFVTAWCWEVGEDSRPVSEFPEPIQEPTRRRLNQFPELLGEIYQSPELRKRLSAAHDAMTIEVCLCVDLLSKEVDSWPLRHELTQDTTPVGRRYPVVVRSFERLYRLGNQGLWNKRCELLKQLEGAGRVLWVRSGLSRDMLRERIHRDEPLCLVSELCFKPELLLMSIEYGLPAMLWIRDEPVVRRSRAFLKLLWARRFLKPLLKGPLTGLPERVYKVRRRGTRKFARHVTLLWDTNEFLPPDARRDAALTTPASTEGESS